MEWIARHGVFLEKENFQPISLSRISEEDYRDFVDLWLSEGIPSAFRDFPHKYQKIRRYGASEFSIDVRDFGLTGSARCGFSLSPLKLLSDFNMQSSDYDVFIVSEKWYEGIKGEYFDLANKGSISMEDGLYKDNLNQFKSNFFSSWLIPFKGDLPYYHRTLRSRITNFYWNFSVVIDRKFPERHKRIRIYKDWNSAKRQLIRNFKVYVKKTKV